MLMQKDNFKEVREGGNQQTNREICAGRKTDRQTDMCRQADRQTGRKTDRPGLLPTGTKKNPRLFTDCKAIFTDHAG